MRALPVLATCLLTLLSTSGTGQDFIMQGCYWSCPEDEPNSWPDSSTLNFWIDRIQSQAAELSFSGFSFFWLPALQADSPPEINALLEYMRKKGISPMADLALTAPNSSLTQSSSNLRQRFQLSAFSLHGEKNMNPTSIARSLNALYERGELPSLLVASLPYFDNPARLGNWTAEVIRNLSEEARREIDPRIYDFVLRESLRQACADSTYDLRLVFERSVRDASAISGFNIVTLANHPFFKNQNGKAGDWDDPIADPLLAYAYLLANNQIGLPSIFYGDYYGASSELVEYIGKAPLRDAINQLMKTHQQFIYGSTAVEYLNRFQTDKASFYYPGGSPSRTLAFQLDGSNSPAGQANRPPGGKDVLVVINFAYDTLRLVQEINMSNIRPGDFFTDVLGESMTPKTNVIPYDSAHDISNALLIELPPRSYSVWVQGSVSKIVPSRIDLSTRTYKDYVELNWEVAYESQAFLYEVERSVNGKQFERLAAIPPLGNEAESASYLYADKDVYPNEHLYYRVKMLDKEGGYEYSPVERARLTKRELAFEYVDSPRSAVKTVKIKSSYEGEAELAVFDAKGKKVLSQRERLQPGDNLSRVDLSALPSGVYFLNFSDGNIQKWSKRIVKM